MSSILEKLGSYQLLTNLLPGAFFVLSLKFFFGISIPTENIGEDVVMYYFIGFIISRIGSLIIEPALKKMNFIKYAPYVEFLKALKIDSKIDILSEMNNFMRSLLTGIILLPLIKIGRELSLHWEWFSRNWNVFIIAFVFLLFLFAYRKQSKYVYRRVEIINSYSNDKEDTKI